VQTQQKSERGAIPGALVNGAPSQGQGVDGEIPGRKLHAGESDQPCTIPIASGAQAQPWQYHTPSWVREKTEQLSGELGEITSAEYDGFVEMTVREADLHMLSEAREDPYYKDVISKDEAYLMDMEGCRQILGWTEVYVDDGEAAANEKDAPNVVTG